MKTETADPQCRPSLTCCASWHVQRSPEANTDKRTQCPPPRTPHRSCAVSCFSNRVCIINPTHISLINLYLRDQRLGNKTETLGLDWQMNVIVLGKSPCVCAHRLTCLSTRCTYMNARECVGCFIPAAHIPALAATAQWVWREQN